MLKLASSGEPVIGCRWISTAVALPLQRGKSADFSVAATFFAALQDSQLFDLQRMATSPERMI